MAIKLYRNGDVILEENKVNSRINWGFAIFFGGILCLFTNAKAQILLFLMIGVYVSYDLLYRKAGKIKKANINNVLLMTSWIGALTLWAFLSKKWAYGVANPSYTMNNLLRLFLIALLMAIYTDTYERAISIIKSYVVGVLIMCIVVMILTPPALYGVEVGEVTFGSVIHQQRNSIGAAAAEAAALSWMLTYYTKFRYGKLFSAFFVVVLLCSGSRGAIIELVIIVGLIILLQKGETKRVKNILIAVAVLILGVVVIQNVPYLYEKIWLRFGAMFATLISKENVDGSAYSRTLMRLLALKLFLDRPILGYGLDGVQCYIFRNPRFLGYTFRAVYSHCNFAELGANFGIVGLFIWYYPVGKMIKKAWDSRNNNPFIRYSIAVLVAAVILDYGRIPWQAIPNMLSYFSLFLLFQNYKNRNKHKI